MRLGKLDLDTREAPDAVEEDIPEFLREESDG